MTPLAIPEVKKRDRDVVVTAGRARWKQNHAAPTERMIRMLRFIWMRTLTYEDRHKLNALTLGALTRAGLVHYDGSAMVAVNPKNVKGY